MDWSTESTDLDWLGIEEPVAADTGSDKPKPRRKPKTLWRPVAERAYINPVACKKVVLPQGTWNSVYEAQTALGVCGPTIRKMIQMYARGEVYEPGRRVAPSEYTRRKIQLSLTGRHLSEEHCLKISQSLRGRTCTEEHRRKVSEATLASWQKRKLKGQCK
jgi:hypothetical protein